MSTAGPQDSPTWPPAPQPAPSSGSTGPQDQLAQRAGAAPLPEAAPPAPPPVRRRPRHPQRIAGAAAGFLVLAAAGGGLVALAGGNRVEKHDFLTREISALAIDAGGGDVTVRAGGPPGTVEVTRKTRSATDLADLALTGWPGSTLTLNCATGCDIDYEIRVPAGVAVTAQTGSGDVELEGNLGLVSLQTGSGDVEADITTTRDLTTRTGSGDLELRFGSVPDLISVESGSGDVDLEVPNGQRYDVDSQSGSGDTDIVVQRQDGADQRIQVKTGSGDITISGG